MSNWTQPGQGFKGLDEQIEAISEQQVMSYFDKLLEQDEEQLVELLGKIKGKIKNFKDKRDFKKRAGELAKHHDDKVKHHVHHGDAHDTASNHHFGKNKNKESEQGRHHDNARDDHAKASKSHDLAKAAAKKGDHKAYKMHSDAAKKHSEKAKSSHDHAVRKSEDDGHDAGDGDVNNHISKKHGGNK